MSRRLPDGIVPAMCRYAEGMESPPIFIAWSAIATVSAVIGRNCFIDQGYFVIYPNLFIVLVSGSARCRKSSAIDIAKDMLFHTTPRVNVLGQKMTPEALIGALSGMIANEGDSVVIPSAVGIAVVSELSTLIDKNSFKSGLIALLTDLYDCKDFEYVTRARGKELVRNPFLSILGGSTIQWIKEAIPEVSIGGGFTSRVVFVYRDIRSKLIAWPVVTDEMRKLKDDIIHDLDDLAKMRGPFGIEDAAKKMYEDEYSNFYHNSPLMDDESLSGYANRRHHILLKVAMVMSASRSNDRVVTVRDMQAALGMMRDAESSMPLVLRALLSNEVGDIFDNILSFIVKKRIVTRRDLIRQFRHKLTASELDVLMRTLEEEGVVRSEVDGGSIRYVSTIAERQ